MERVGEGLGARFEASGGTTRRAFGVGLRDLIDDRVKEIHQVLGALTFDRLGAIKGTPTFATGGVDDREIEG